MKVVGVSFKENGRLYYFKNNILKLAKGDFVIVETEKGLQFGFVVQEESELEEKTLVNPIKNVIRLATKNDRKNHQKNLRDANYALLKARRIVKDLNLNMNILDASYTFDKKQLLFNFTADDRVDFRELAKRLAAIYRTRIELRQIGIRDKARNVGGIGPCGRFLCCNTFLTDLNSVTINMAKNQMLALNPTKINGVCGRLLCCLSYEDETYTYLKKDLPNIGDNYKYDGNIYKVIDVDIFKRKITLEGSEHTEFEVFVDESTK